jgi:hypothetical protein
MSIVRTRIVLNFCLYLVIHSAVVLPVVGPSTSMPYAILQFLYLVFVRNVQCTVTYDAADRRDEGGRKSDELSGGRHKTKHSRLTDRLERLRRPQERQSEDEPKTTTTSALAERGILALY